MLTTPLRAVLHGATLTTGVAKEVRDERREGAATALLERVRDAVDAAMIIAAARMLCDTSGTATGAYIRESFEARTSSAEARSDGLEPATQGPARGLEAMELRIAPEEQCVEDNQRPTCREESRLAAFVLARGFRPEDEVAILL
ncbi:hypothetical protein AXG93_406s1490 [Marchantia polymorpha subsp. ruderalis]|uniref:Uncharacterized protein n=1 Tax=Marchantia polymorpha subsp. ruderalis TaxID=1480154 RepID=A0A176VD00_MARPO|nr:hypothetical protein AXG93_406s1490 [Marchantia polymorpha subsp. ruderalis]